MEESSSDIAAASNALQRAGVTMDGVEVEDQGIGKGKEELNKGLQMSSSDPENRDGVEERGFYAGGQKDELFGEE